MAFIGILMLAWGLGSSFTTDMVKDDVNVNLLTLLNSASAQGESGGGEFDGDGWRCYTQDCYSDENGDYVCNSCFGYEITCRPGANICTVTSCTCSPD